MKAALGVLLVFVISIVWTGGGIKFWKWAREEAEFDIEEAAAVVLIFGFIWDIIWAIVAIMWCFS